MSWYVVPSCLTRCVWCPLTYKRVCCHLDSRSPVPRTGALSLPAGTLATGLPVAAAGAVVEAAVPEMLLATTVETEEHLQQTIL